jgi:hypothetical protein
MNRWALVNSSGIVQYITEQDTQPVLPGYTSVNISENQGTIGMYYDGNTFSWPNSSSVANTGA